MLPPGRGGDKLGKSLELVPVAAPSTTLPRPAGEDQGEAGAPQFAGYIHFRLRMNR